MQATRVFLAATLAAVMVVLGPLSINAHAGLISTETVLQVDSPHDATRARLHALLDREQIRQELERRGVASDEAHARIDALSDAEVASLAGRLDSLPAGGSFLGTVLVVAVAVFVVLIILDAAGVTDVFPWVTHTPSR